MWAPDYRSDVNTPISVNVRDILMTAADWQTKPEMAPFPHLRGGVRIHHLERAVYTVFCLDNHEIRI